jgi:hypothetical protein
MLEAVAEKRRVHPRLDGRGVIVGSFFATSSRGEIR